MHGAASATQPKLRSLNCVACAFSKSLVSRDGEQGFLLPIDGLHQKGEIFRAEL